MDSKGIPSNADSSSKLSISIAKGIADQLMAETHDKTVGQTSAVIDRFGRDVVVMKEDERHFRITVSVSVSNQFYGWVFGLGKAVRIIGPESVKEGMKKSFADIAARYE